MGNFNEQLWGDSPERHQEAGASGGFTAVNHEDGGSDRSTSEPAQGQRRRRVSFVVDESADNIAALLRSRLSEDQLTAVVSALTGH